MKQFNLEEYKRLKAEGKTPRVVTRDGREAKMDSMTSDLIGCKTPYSVRFEIMEGENQASLREYTNDGRFIGSNFWVPNELDLFFAEPDESSKYRAYTDTDECMREVLRHGGWVRFKERFSPEIRYPVQMVSSDTMRLVNRDFFFEAVKNMCVWADDDTPCGIKET